MIKKKEILELSEEEAQKDIKNLREDLSILFEQEDKKMRNPRKLLYSEHWMAHWRKKIVEQYVFFYNLGKGSHNNDKIKNPSRFIK